MINIGDELICTDGNDFFVEGQVYTVGSIINEQLFEINIGSNGEYWYALEDSDGIYVRFNSLKGKVSVARFAEVKRQDSVVTEIYQSKKLLPILD